METEQINELAKVIGGYAGGQLSILRGDIISDDRKHYCGTIENIAIEGDKLTVKLAWNASLVPLKTNKNKTKWVGYDELDYLFDLNKYEVSTRYDHSEKRVLELYEGCELRCRPEHETIFLRGPTIKGRLNPLWVKGL